MDNDALGISVTGINKITANLDRFRESINKDMGAAGEEAANEILDTVGLRSYPPETNANRPPTPYYIRGRGMQRAGRIKPEYNDLKSQRYGSNWTIETNYNSVIIGNKVTYAKYLSGDEQVSWAARYGWKKLWDIARDKLDRVQRIYQGWIDRFIRIHNL